MPPTQRASWTKIAMGSDSPEAEKEVSQAMTRLRHSVLLRPTKLWIRAQVKDVVKKLVSDGPQPTEEELLSSPGLQPRQHRARGLKVIDNPMKKVSSSDLPPAEPQDEL